MKFYVKLYVEKCRLICFSKKTTPSISLYLLKNNSLDIVNVVKDLVILSSENCIPMLTAILLSAKVESLGWSEKVDTRAILVLYNSFIGSILEYNCIICAPCY